MSIEIIQTLLNASGAAGVTLIFVFYLTKRDKREADTMSKFNTTITTHLQESNKVQRELSGKLQEFSDTNKELRNAIQALYQHNFKQARKIISYEEKLKSQRFSK